MIMKCLIMKKQYQGFILTKKYFHERADKMRTKIFNDRKIDIICDKFIKICGKRNNFQGSKIFYFWSVIWFFGSNLFLFY